MAGYSVFARYYDALTRNVDYAARAAYFETLLQHLNHPAGLTLDLACGTGSLTLELFKRGFDIYGADGSAEMLLEAKNKAYDLGADVLFLRQKMEKLDLFGTVDTVICALDSINHLSDAAAVQETFRRVAFFLNDDGWFIFDVNTPYKHEKVLGNNTFVYDLEEVYCAWQNRYDARSGSVSIALDFFERQEKHYTRSSTRFSEQAYSEAVLRGMLRTAGFDRVEVFGDMRLDAPHASEQRLIVAAHITNSQNRVAEE